MINKSGQALRQFATSNETQNKELLSFRKRTLISTRGQREDRASYVASLVDDVHVFTGEEIVSDRYLVVNEINVHHLCR